MNNMQSTTEKVVAKIEELGVLGFSLFMINRLIGRNKINPIDFYSFIEIKEVKPNASSRQEKLRLAWFIPTYNAGAGGHLNIFRMIYHLENLGVESDLYLCGRTQWPSAKAAKEVIAKHFFPLKGEMRLLDSSNINDYGKEYDLAVATSWYTAYYVRGFGLCRKKAYFVQDYEPYFFAKGSECQFAEQTYKFGFYGITAGDWLRETLIQKYGMDCASFKFSYDRHLYRFHERENDGVKRVFFYARPLSARRGFELGMLALNRLCQRNPTVEVILAGADVSRYSIPFKHSNPGVVSLQNLSDIYGKCDLALVLSFTNLSLLPLEILASGCPVLLNKGRNNSWIDENEIFLYTDPDIDSLVENMEAVLKGKIDARPYVERARKYLTTSSWEKEAETVRDIIGGLLT